MEEILWQIDVKLQEENQDLERTLLFHTKETLDGLNLIFKQKKYWLASENRWVKLKVSTRGNKIIDKRGIESVVKEIRQRGEKV